ncbi:hypothetical protein OH76DRAFT_177861 [Lentinus brumalis]|uniref:Uncharacterized protein n=1 Tax=Lentinus brumalis TaxID=2498619 RepID=A0A371CNI5_9APHY|nr:hypothetical protein OH76DRAFT_177861 [Polyporus brumalis]
MYPVKRLCVKMAYAHGLPTCCLTPGGSGGGSGHGARVLTRTGIPYCTACYPILISLPASAFIPSGILGCLGVTVLYRLGRWFYP